MILKNHKLDDGRLLVVVIDKSLKGTKHQDGEKQLDFTGDFYDGEECLPEDAGDSLRNANMINIAGKEAVRIALEEGIVLQEDIKMIAGIPYAQAVLT